MKKIAKLVQKHPLMSAAVAGGVVWLLTRRRDDGEGVDTGSFDLSTLQWATLDDGDDVDVGPDASGPEPQRVEGPEDVKSLQWYTSKWILGEGPAKLNQWAQLAETAMSAVGTALAPVMGPIASQAVSVVAGIIGSIKTKDRWVTAPPGVWRTVAFVDGKPTVRALLKWGREKYGDSGMRRWELTTPRNTSGDLPLVYDAEIFTSSDPARKYVYDGVSKSVAKNVTWIQAPGPAQPELWVAVEGGQTEIMLWLPARGGDAKDGRYYYDLDLELG